MIKNGSVLAVSINAKHARNRFPGSDWMRLTRAEAAELFMDAQAAGIAPSDQARDTFMGFGYCEFTDDNQGGRVFLKATWPPALKEIPSRWDSIILGLTGGQS